MGQLDVCFLYSMSFLQDVINKKSKKEKYMILFITNINLLDAKIEKDAYLLNNKNKKRVALEK